MHRATKNKIFTKLAEKKSVPKKCTRKDNRFCRHFLTSNVKHRMSNIDTNKQSTDIHTTNIESKVKEEIEKAIRKEKK